MSGWAVSPSRPATKSMINASNPIFPVPAAPRYAALRPTWQFGEASGEGCEGVAPGSPVRRARPRYSSGDQADVSHTAGTSPENERLRNK